MNDLIKLLVGRVNQPDPNPFLFNVGQTVRVCKSVTDDGQTPAFWAGARATVVSRRATIFSKTHSYKLRHDNGSEDYFEESELDFRFADRKAGA